MTEQTTTPAAQDIRVALAQLLMDLQERSAAKHAAAITKGHGTPTGRGYEGQSHAYANSAMWLQGILDAHTD